MRIFDISPFQYGHRGDEVIWTYFRSLSEEEYNKFISDIDSYLASFFDSHTIMFDSEKNIGVIKDIEFFGCSSHDALVSYNWWVSTGIPLIKERLGSPETSDCWKSRFEIMEEMFKDD